MTDKLTAQLHSDKCFCGKPTAVHIVRSVSCGNVCKEHATPGATRGILSVEECAVVTRRKR